MSLKFFLKIYLRLALIGVTVVLVCWALFAGINSAREKIWHEQAAAPLMRWLASDPEPLARYHWMRSLFGLSVRSPSQLDLSPVMLERLDYGQVVGETAVAGYRYHALANDGHVVSLHLDQPYRDIARASALIVRWHLDNTSGHGRLAIASDIGRALNLQLVAIQNPGQLPDQSILDSLGDRPLVIFGDRRQARVLLRLADGELWMLTPAEAFDPWGWPILLMLVIVLGGVLALGLYMGLQQIDTHMRRVESVAIRIRRGEMGARVDSDDGSPVSRLAASFNSMAEHIQRLVEVQREMIHAVSHELRTPVARIRFGVQMVESASSPEALEKQLRGIDGDIQELDELIDEILTYARLEQGGPVFSLQESSVPDIVAQVVSEQGLIREGVRIETRIDDCPEAPAMADMEPRYIHRALQNLVGNAARHASGRVIVRCHLDEENCRIDVEDDGPGIPEKDWERVFTAFARLDDSRTRQSGGYGLGLSIVRRILYWHGGQAFVSRSNELGGARFSLVWPRHSLGGVD